MAERLSEPSGLAEPPLPSIKKISSRLKQWVNPFAAANKSAHHTLKDALEEVIEHHEEESRAISDQERLILLRMMKLGELTVSDVMVPRTEIVAIDYEVTLSELKEIIAREQHTRMPVYEEDLDKLKGFIHLKDLVPALAGDVPFDIDGLLREIYFVSPSMRLIDLLVHMRISGHHLGIVVDEYGGTDGLITLEDVFEALVGEIQDEHDIADGETPLLKRINSNQFDIDARMRISVLEEEIGLNLREIIQEEDYDTLAGFIFASLQRIPLIGEMVYLPEIGHLRIMDADPRRVKRVQMTLNYTPLPIKKPVIS